MHATSIKDLLVQDLHNAQMLAALLTEEKQQLEKRDLPALSALLSRKAELLAGMERNDNARREQLNNSGFASDRQGLQAFCEHHDQQQSAPGDGQSATELFVALQEQLSRCQELTEINGAIVHRSRVKNSKALDILRGKKSEPGIYTSAGSTRSRDESHDLGNA